VTIAKVAEGSSAVSRLAALGIEPHWLVNAVMAGEAEAQLCTDLDPPIARGLARFCRTVRRFREQAIPKGWGFDNRRNLSRTTNPSREFAVIAAAGNELTGLAGAEPSTKYGKGITVVEAVAQNMQLELDLAAVLPEGVDLEVDLEAAVGAGIATWVLLYHRDSEEIRLEVSLPAAMTGGFISRWSERIILPPIPAEPTVHIEELPAEYEVQVERRARPA
jgi:hypothetical protein